MMQTFVPVPNAHQCAVQLDWRRLGKQRVECKQILTALEHWANDDLFKENGRQRGWVMHPATLMWRHPDDPLRYREALRLYYNHMVKQWIARGYNNTMPLYSIDHSKVIWPPWWGDAAVHRSHQANLVRKDPDFYIPLYGDLPFEEYIWPMMESQAHSS